MADWYVSSVAYAALPAWAATTAYTVGQIIRPTAAAIGAQYPQRCTTAGTTAASEPSTWQSGNNITTTSGTAVFTNVAGQLTYGWSAAAGTLRSIDLTRTVVGDRIFLSSDHSEVAVIITWTPGGAVNAFGLVQIISVNRAGSVPPVAGDIQNGATLGNTSGNVQLEAYCNVLWQGVTFTVASGGFVLNSAATHSHYFKNCAFVFAATINARFGNNAAAKVTLDNTTIQFGQVGQFIGASTTGPFELLWINTPSAIVGATIPTVLFSGAAQSLSVTCRGVDLSAVVNTLLKTTTASEIGKVLLDSCRIAPGVTRYALTSTTGDPAGDEIELVNCFDGTNVVNERHTAAGDVTTDAATTLSGGARDDVGGYSHKLVSSARADICAMPLDGFWLDVGNTGVGVSKTATVEIISSAALNNNDVKLQLEYMGTAGSSLGAFGESLASVLTAAAALPSSSVTWSNPPSTPQKQFLQVPFTPQTAGRVKGLVRLGKPSTTMWVNPQVAVAVVQTLTPGLVSDGDASYAATIAAAAPFTPAALAGLIGWWDASVTASLSLSGSSINSVADQSAGGNTATWFNVKPTYNATGFNSTKPAIMLGGGSCIETAATFPMGTGNNLTAWAVCTMGASGTPNHSRMLSYRAPTFNDFNSLASWFFGGQFPNVLEFFSTTIAANSSAVTPDPALHRFIVTINAGAITLYVDGVSVGTGSKSGNWATGGRLAIGFNTGTSDGTIFTSMGECGVATGYSNATTVGQLDTYLKNKWGL